MDVTAELKGWRKALAVLLAVVLVLGLSPAVPATNQAAWADETSTDASSPAGTNGAGNAAAEGASASQLTISPKGMQTASLNATALADGTYEAANIATDVTTDVSGMIMVTKATVVIKDGQAYAIVTMKGKGADRFYVSDTATKDTIIAEAVAEEAKEIDGQESKLLGSYLKEGESAYTFWPVPIELGVPKVYAARSESHFKKWDLPRENYFYVHDFQINEADLTYVSDATDIMTPEADAQVYMDQFYVGNGISSDHASVIKAKDTAVTVPYYDGDAKISSFKFKRPDASQFVSGWFVDNDGLNYLSSSNKKKIRYPGFTNAFSMQAAKRDAGGTFTATLKLYPAGTSYNQYDANDVYYYTDSSNTTPATPLAEQTFTITVQEKPEIDFNVAVSVVDSKTNEAIEGATVRITDESDSGEVTANPDGTYLLNALKKYTVAASAEGYVAQGGAAEATKTGFTPASEGETVTLKLLKEEDATHTMTFTFVDQFGDAVADPTVKVMAYGTTDEIAANPDGSYTLYDGENYRYEATAVGYEDKVNYRFSISEDTAETVQMNKYLDNHIVTYTIYDAQTNEVLDGVTLVVTNDDTGQEIPQETDGSFIVPADTNITCVASKEGYQSSDFSNKPSGFEREVRCSFSLQHSNKRLLEEEIAKATAYNEGIVEADEPGKWPEGTKAALEQAIADAQAVLDSTDSTEEDYQTATTALEAAEKAAANAQNYFEANVTVRVNKTPGGVAELYKFTATGAASKTYSYSEPTTVGKQVSLIDVIAGVHEQIYGEAYTANPKDYFNSENVGFYWISKLFESGNYYQFALNGGSTGNYQSCIVSDGDVVDISLMQKTNDIFLAFDELEISTRVGREVSATLTQGVSTKKAAEGYVVTLANEEGVEVQGSADAEGKVALTFEQPGTYTVTAATKEGASASPVLPYLKVEVAPKRYYYWMQIRGSEPIAEQNYSIHGTGEVVTLADSTGTATVIEPPTGTYYVLDNLTEGETYTVTVEPPEGYALVTNRYWSVPDHGYVNETDGTTTWTNTFTVTDEKEFLGNMIVQFVKVPEQAEVDWSAVDAAIAKVPGVEKGDLGNFTDQTAGPLQEAVAAVDREETDQAKVDAMAAAIEDAIKNLIPKNGRFAVAFDKANATPYYIYEGLNASDRTLGMGELVVKDGAMELHAVVKNSSYAHAYVGTKDEAIAAAPDGDTAPEGTIYLTENADNAANRDVVLPVAKFNEQLQYAYHSSNASRYNMQQGWYDHGVIFQANSVTLIEAEPVVEDLVVSHVGTPLWVAGASAEITAQVEGLSAGETVAKWYWEYSGDGKTWKKTGAKSFCDETQSTLIVSECTTARKPPMAWRVTVTTSDERTATSEGQSLTVLEDLSVAATGQFDWVAGQAVDISAAAAGLAPGEEVASYSWFYSRDNTTWKKTGAKATQDGNVLSLAIPECTPARKAPMAWCVKVTTTSGRTATSKGISLVG